MSKVFLAAGHHPERPGAGFDGFFEHDEAARWLAAMLALDVNGDCLIAVPSGPLKQKVAFVNHRARKGDVAVEVHFNSCVKDGKHVGDGCVTLCMPGSEGGRKLAESCQGVLAEHFPPSRGVVDGWYRGDQSKGAYYFLERTVCPAVILEPEFVHHKTLIQSKREACCAALASSLSSFVGGVL